MDKNELRFEFGRLKLQAVGKLSVLFLTILVLVVFFNSQ